MGLPTNLANGNMAAPATSLVKVDGSDTVNFDSCRGLLVGTAGAARIVTVDDVDTGGTNLVPLQQGYNPIACKRIYLTGLTASNIWALY